MARKTGPFLGRRGFLKGAGLAALAAPLAPKTADAQAAAPHRAPSIPATPNLEAERGHPSDIQPDTQSSCGADFMLDT